MIIVPLLLTLLCIHQFYNNQTPYRLLHCSNTSRTFNFYGKDTFFHIGENSLALCKSTWKENVQCVRHLRSYALSITAALEVTNVTMGYDIMLHIRLALNADCLIGS